MEVTSSTSVAPIKPSFHSEREPVVHSAGGDNQLESINAVVSNIPPNEGTTVVTDDGTFYIDVSAGTESSGTEVDRSDPSSGYQRNRRGFLADAAAAAGAFSVFGSIASAEEKKDSPIQDRLNTQLEELVKLERDKVYDKTNKIKALAKEDFKAFSAWYKEQISDTDKQVKGYVEKQVALEAIGRRVIADWNSLPGTHAGEKAALAGQIFPAYTTIIARNNSGSGPELAKHFINSGLKLCDDVIYQDLQTIKNAEVKAGGKHGNGAKRITAGIINTFDAALQGVSRLEAKDLDGATQTAIWEVLWDGECFGDNQDKAELAKGNVNDNGIIAAHEKLIDIMSKNYFGQKKFQPEPEGLDRLIGRVAGTSFNGNSTPSTGWPARVLYGVIERNPEYFIATIEDTAKKLEAQLSSDKKAEVKEDIEVMDRALKYYAFFASIPRMNQSYYYPSFNVPKDYKCPNTPVVADKPEESVEKPKAEHLGPPEPQAPVAPPVPAPAPAPAQAQPQQGAAAPLRAPLPGVIGRMGAWLAAANSRGQNAKPYYPYVPHSRIENVHRMIEDDLLPPIGNVFLNLIKKQTVEAYDHRSIRGRERKINDKNWRHLNESFVKLAAMGANFKTAAAEIIKQRLEEDTNPYVREMDYVTLGVVYGVDSKVNEYPGFDLLEDGLVESSTPQEMSGIGLACVSALNNNEPEKLTKKEFVGELKKINDNASERERLYALALREHDAKLPPEVIKEKDAYYEEYKKKPYTGELLRELASKNLSRPQRLIVDCMRITLGQYDLAYKMSPNLRIHPEEHHTFKTDFGSGEVTLTKVFDGEVSEDEVAISHFEKKYKRTEKKFSRENQVPEDVRKYMRMIHNAYLLIAYSASSYWAPDTGKDPNTEYRNQMTEFLKRNSSFAFTGSSVSFYPEYWGEKSAALVDIDPDFDIAVKHFMFDNSGKNETGFQNAPGLFNRLAELSTESNVSKAARQSGIQIPNRNDFNYGRTVSRVKGTLAFKKLQQETNTELMVLKSRFAAGYLASARNRGLESGYESLAKMNRGYGGMELQDPHAYLANMQWYKPDKLDQTYQLPRVKD